eukprot:CAMPEP_0204608956 /NCGR_PEP_ID=MMETSP0661-20131031/60637_1 /ASSEMBLY_ACC=CAM_ASM_000606 /TAXON_ID=109239 /ORGANISM="Alexandrium margalefi, Strain AMGDE01CS-322" /LENGTH=69 /DNA_ID=CAMNT_0051620567 /DNA_START=64 /DNA_END=270 /DNA_ORIENTATION=+
MNWAVVHHHSTPTLPSGHQGPSAIQGKPAKTSSEQELVSSVFSPPGAFGVVDELPVELLRLLGVELLAA